MGPVGFTLFLIATSVTVAVLVANLGNHGFHDHKAWESRMEKGIIAGFFWFGAGVFCYFAYHRRIISDAETRLSQGNVAASAGAASTDLDLARKALQRGEAARGESRVAQAEDKLNASKTAAPPPEAVSKQKSALEKRYGGELDQARRKRVSDRLSREGAER